MKEIQRAKKLEVAQYYIFGFTYGEIEELTGGHTVASLKLLEILKVASWLSLEQHLTR